MSEPEVRGKFRGKEVRPVGGGGGSEFSPGTKVAVVPDRQPEPDPLESNYPELNAAFYAERPWDYFRQRLVHLAAIASDPGELPFGAPIAVGPVTIERYAPKTGRYPTPGQAFVAIESEVLLHHAAERRKPSSGWFMPTRTRARVPGPG
jgi:hypothetical protein